MKSLFDALSHALVQTVFIAWFKSKRYEGSPEKLLQNMTESVWRAFNRSAHAQQLAIDLGYPLPKFDNSLKGKILNLSGAPSSPKSAPATDPHPIPVPVADPHPTPLPVSQVCTKTCVGCGKTIPAFSGAAAQCNACHLADLGAVAGLQPVPVAVTDPQRVAATATGAQPGTDPLIQLLAERLNAAGILVPQTQQHGACLTPEQLDTLVSARVAEGTRAAIESLLADGTLVRRQELRITINDQPPITLSGRTPQWFTRLVKLAQCRVNALLVGPPGSGKTTGAAMLAQSLNLPFYRVSLSAGVDEGVLQGWLLPVEVGGRFVYVPSTVVTAYEHGGVVLLDELDAGDPNMLIILSAVLDNGQWAIPMRHEQPDLQRHPDFIVIGAANTFGHGASRHHSGAQQLDSRTLSRFAMGQIYCDYDSELERDLFDADVVETGHRIRNRCRALPEFGRDISTRDIETAHKKLAAFTPDEVWYDFFQDWSTDELERIHVVLEHTTGTAVCA